MSAPAAPASVGLPPGWRLLDFDSIDSTNDEARRQAEVGAPEGTVVRAVRQTAGRGRSGRSWSSTDGNLHCSVLLRPGMPAAVAAQASLVTGVAVTAALTELAPSLAFGCKWPNDVLCGGRKLCGVLLEAGGADGANPEWVVVGIGVNVATAPDLPDLIHPATSLQAEGADVSVDTVLEAVCRHLHSGLTAWRTGGMRRLREAWQARAAGIGQMATVRLPNGAVTGRLVGLDRDGAMVLAQPDGTVQRILAGDVFFASAPRMGAVSSKDG